MDSANPQKRRRFHARLSGLKVAWLLFAGVTSLSGQEAARAQDADGAAAIQDPRSYWRLSDLDNPRKGFLIAPTQAERTGYNFEYCNGDQATVDASKLLRVDTDCDDEPSGPWYQFGGMSPERIVGAPIYLATHDGGYRRIGEIAGVSPLANAGWDATNALIFDEFRTGQPLEGTGARYLDVLDLRSDAFDVVVEDSDLLVLARDGRAFSAEPDDIVDTAVKAGSFSTLVAAAKAAGLLDSLDSEGPFTVFAPTDEAFAALPEGTLEELLANPERLRMVLNYHVLPGTLTIARLFEGDLTTATRGTVGGANVTLERGARVTVNGATVLVPDIEASNGVVHVIDAVILPDP